MVFLLVGEIGFEEKLLVEVTRSLDSIIRSLCVR